VRAAKFWIGVILIFSNFIFGKIATFLFILYYDVELWRRFSLWLYVFSWIMLFAGIYLCGKEGWDYSVKKYREYHERTVKTIKHHGYKTYSKVKEGVKKQIRER